MSREGRKARLICFGYLFISAGRNGIKSQEPIPRNAGPDPETIPIIQFPMTQTGFGEGLLFVGWSLEFGVCFYSHPRQEYGKKGRD